MAQPSWQDYLRREASLSAEIKTDIIHKDELPSIELLRKIFDEARRAYEAQLLSSLQWNLGEMYAVSLKELRKSSIDSTNFIINENLKLVTKKQKDYGPENILAFGVLGVLVRLSDKVSRLENLLKKGGGPMFESVQDTYSDIMGYCLIGRMLINGTFLTELTDD